jgi:hypothetical protein
MRRLTLISGSVIEKLPHDIGDDPSSLAFFLSSIQEAIPVKAVSKPPKTLEGGKKEEDGGEDLPGVYDTKESKKMTILASNVEVDSHDGSTSVSKSSFFLLVLDL